MSERQPGYVVLPCGTLMRHLSTAVHLSFGKQTIVCLPPLAQPQQITELRLMEYTAPVELPQGVDQLTALEALHFIWCRHALAVPASVGTLTGLTSLRIVGCVALTTLPASIGRLTALQTLSISDCESLTHVPETVGACTALRELHVINCRRLARLPDSIEQLIALRLINWQVYHPYQCETNIAQHDRLLTHVQPRNRVTMPALLTLIVAGRQCNSRTHAVLPPELWQYIMMEFLV